MIIGIGNDIIEISRITKAIGNTLFINKYFTKCEIDYYNKKKCNPEVLAGNFAVKESVAKVLGTGFIGFSLADVEVLRDDLGKPYVNLYNRAKEIADELGIMHMHVSISHSSQYAIGLAIGEK